MQTPYDAKYVHNCIKKEYTPGNVLTMVTPLLCSNSSYQCHTARKTNSDNQLDRNAMEDVNEHIRPQSFDNKYSFDKL